MISDSLFASASVLPAASAARVGREAGGAVEPFRTTSARRRGTRSRPVGPPAPGRRPRRPPQAARTASSASAATATVSTPSARGLLGEQPAPAARGERGRRGTGRGCGGRRRRPASRWSRWSRAGRGCGVRARTDSPGRRAVVLRAGVRAGACSASASGRTTGARCASPSSCSPPWRRSCRPPRPAPPRPARGPSPAGLAVPAHRPAADVRAYWTPRRMAAARPGELALGSGVRFARPSTLDGYLRRLAPGRAASSAPGRGAGVDRRRGPSSAPRARSSSAWAPTTTSAAGSAVAHPDRSTVLTAGHCVVDPESGTRRRTGSSCPATRRQGAVRRLPGPTWSRRRLGHAEDFDVDLAFADVAANAAGVRLGDAVGGQRIAFGTPRGRDALRLRLPRRARRGRGSGSSPARARSSRTPPVPSPGPGLSLHHDAGLERRPVVLRLRPADRHGTLTSLTSFSYVEQPGVLWGPYLGAEAQACTTPSLHPGT
jgi:hypothetical protein